MREYEVDDLAFLKQLVWTVTKFEEYLQSEIDRLEKGL